MYVSGNPKTKKALKELVAEGLSHNEPGHVYGPECFSPGPFPAKADGVEYVEGPHYPKPHTWTEGSPRGPFCTSTVHVASRHVRHARCRGYAKVQVEDGVIVKVLS